MRDGRHAGGGLVACAALGALLACVGNIGDVPPVPAPPEPAGEYAEAGLRLLTPVQYQNSVRDLLGAEVPVAAVGQWRSSIAAAQGGVSLTAVEEYELAARDASAFVFGDEDRRMALVGCEPAIEPADACATAFVTTFARRAWRRPASAEEVERYAALAAATGGILGDAWRGLEHAVVGVLQSPSFLYRVELGEPDPASPDRLRYSSHEMATRLGYFLWNTTPDDALLDLADGGALVDDATIAAEIDRLLASDRARHGSLQFFTDMLDLDALLHIEKDTNWLPLYTETLGPAMRTELLATIEGVVFGEAGDYRDLFDTRSTFVDAELANLYELPGTFGDDFEPVELAADGPRAGILTLGGLMMMHSGAADTSPTRRGKFVRNVILCQEIPPPPPGIVTTLPEAAPGELVTTRDLLEKHRTDPSCAACHGFMDPIGLALEHFDAIGAFRAKQNGITIDTSGDLDGVTFDDARGLGTALRDHPELAVCLVRRVYQYATGHMEQGVEKTFVGEITDAFVAESYDVRGALRMVGLSKGFRRARAPEPVAAAEVEP